MSLKISTSRTLPLKFLSLRKVVFGGSGAGKTTFGRTLFEEATDAGVLCGAIDLKGDWWGLKSTSDGSSDGIPVVIFGGEHQDVPLDEDGGAALAEILVSLRQPFVIDLEQLSRRKQMKFLGPFFDRLYDKNREPLVLFCDEVDRYAPQKPMSPEANECLGATEDIAKRGRKHGIFPVFITQRNASLNKNVSELCDVAIVFRTAGPNDQNAVEEWFGTKATREQRDEVMEKLAGLADGTAIVCSAHPALKLFAEVPMRLPWTFDSSATPEIGKRRIEPKRLAKPDLEKIQQQMATTIEKAKADDPRELRRRIQDLEGELRRKNLRPTQPEVAPKRVEVPILKDAQIKRLEYLGERVEKILKAFDDWRAAFVARGEDLRAAAIEISAAVRTAMQKSSQVPAATQPREISVLQPVLANRTHIMPSDIPSAGNVGQRILNALAELEQMGASQPDRELVAFLAGYSNVTSKGFANAIGALRTEGLIEYPTSGSIVLTDMGRRKAQPPARPRTPEEVQQRIVSMLGGASSRILAPLINEYPKALEREDLAARAGYGNVTSKGFANAIGRLRTLGFVTYPDRGSIKAAPILFLEAR